MDLWSIFRGSPEKQIERLRKKVKEPHGDASVRQNAAARLFEMGTEPAIRALLDRYTITVSPSVQDELEKQDIYNWLVTLGRKAVPPLIDFIKTERAVHWPARILQGILDPEEQAAEFNRILDFMWKNPPASAIPKNQLIRMLDDVYSPQLDATIRKFLDDDDDDARLAAIHYLMGRPEEEAREAILQCYMESQDRPRVRMRILELFMDTGWSVRGFRPAVEESLPESFSLTREGKIRRVGS
jgi:HEAT repeat protein